MRKFLLVALVAIATACSAKDTPTGPVAPPVTPTPVTPPVTPPPPARAVVVVVWNVLPSGSTLRAPDTTTATVRSGNFKDSVLIRGQGSVTFPTSTLDSVFISLPGNQQYPPVVASVPKAVFDGWRDTVRIVRVPRSWVIRKGMYTGREEATDLVRPYKKTSDRTSFYRRVGNDSMGYSYPQLGWNQASFPLKIWIDVDSSFRMSGVRPDADDSANLASGLADLSILLGWSPFTMSSQAVGGPIRAVVSSFSNAQAVVFNNAGFELFSGSYWTTRLSRFRGHSEVKHEAIHMLEFGHTCEWAGLMPGGCSAWKDGTVDETYLDVAYIELWYAVNVARRETGAQIHWGENLNGTILEINPQGKIDRVVYR